MEDSSEDKKTNKEVDLDPSLKEAKNEVIPPSNPLFSKENQSKWFIEKEFSDFVGIPGLNTKTQQLYPDDLISTLNDKIIINAFKSIIEFNQWNFTDKVILDFNTDMGLNSFTCAKFKPKKIYLLEPDLIKFLYLKQIIKDNGYEDLITPINKTAFNIKNEIDQKEIDVIIGNPCGYCLLKNSMFNEMIYARNNFLKKGGMIFPNKVKVYLAAIENREYKEKKIKRWNNIYGINMNSIQKEVLADPEIEYVDYRKIISDKCLIYEADFFKIEEEDLEYSSAYKLKINKNNANFSGLCLWFDMIFDRTSNKLSISTEPEATQTNYNQTEFYFKEDYQLNKGDFITGSFCCKADDKMDDFEGLDIKISVNFRSEYKHKPIIQLFKMK